MRVLSLQSGSNGNCLYVEAGGARLLFDAGISARTARGRMKAHGLDPGEVDALLISHDHSDHSRSLGIFQRMFALPAYATRKTLAAAFRRCALGALGELRYFDAGAAIRVGGATVETIPTPHDGADGAAFIVDDGRRRLGIFTDLGHVFDALPAAVASLDAVFLESNYDPEMLAAGPYPEFLQRRIRGRGGHLSNIEAARLLAEAGGDRLQWACLGHLSEHNNRPELALETHRRLLGRRLPLWVASRWRASEMLEV
jgi:phosphoribosyl 1,2-cyclic phosphodiesterase